MSHAVLMSTMPLMMFLPGAVLAIAAVRRHLRFGYVEGRSRTVALIRANALTVIVPAGLIALVAPTSIALSSPGWGLLMSGALALLGCGASWWAGSTTRWHRPAVQNQTLDESDMPR